MGNKINSVNANSIRMSLLSTFGELKAFNKDNQSREISLTITKLEEAIMWFEKHESIKRMEEIYS